MPLNFRKMSVSNGETRFAHPGDITHTATVSVNTTPKSAGVVALTNNKMLYVEGLQLPVTNGTSNAKENCSIRIQVSGSTQNAAVIKAHVIRACANVASIMDDKGLEGFMPEITLNAGE